MKIYRLFPAFLIAFLLSGCVREEQVMDGDGMFQIFEYTQISQEEAKEMMKKDDGHIVVDVRREDEYAEGHIPGAILIPNESIGNDPPKELTDPNQIILIYCRSGRRSKEAAQKLADMGYSNVYEFGGIIDWTGDIEKHEQAEEKPEEKEDEDMNTENIELFTQNSIRITSSAGKIYIDPFRINEETHDADFVLITHSHYDHYSPEDIEKVVNEKTILVVPESMSEEAGELTNLVDMITTVEPDAHRDIKGLSIDTVPAYNNKKAFHPKSENWVGYILDIDGMRVYIAGDTDMTDDNRKVTCDVAMVPIGGTYTMDAGEAAALINEIKPQIAIPTHYGAVVGSEEDAETFKSLVEDPVEVEIKKQY